MHVCCNKKREKLVTEGHIRSAAAGEYLIPHACVRERELVSEWVGVCVYASMHVCCNKKRNKLLTEGHTRSISAGEYLIPHVRVRVHACLIRALIEITCV